MNIILSTIASATMLTTPLPIDLSAIASANPIECLAFSVSGVGVEIDADGLSAVSGGTSELSMTVTLKSGTPIRVTL